MTASYAEIAVRRKPWPFSSMPSAPNPPTVEENVPWTNSSSRTGRSVGRSSSSRRLELAPLLHVGVGQVDEAGPDVRPPSSRWPSRGLPARRSGTPALAPRPATRSPSMPLVRRPRRPAGLAAARGPRLHGDLEPRGPGLGVERPGALGRVHRQVPGVDPVALEQHDRVLAGRYVDLELHVPGPVARRLPSMSLVARGVRSTRSTCVETCVLERRDERVLAGHGTPSGPPGRSRVRVFEAGSASYDEGVVTRSVPPAKVDAMT